MSVALQASLLLLLTCSKPLNLRPFIWYLFSPLLKIRGMWMFVFIEPQMLSPWFLGSSSVLYSERMVNIFCICCRERDNPSVLSIPLCSPGIDPSLLKERWGIIWWVNEKCFYNYGAGCDMVIGFQNGLGLYVRLENELIQCYPPDHLAHREDGRVKSQDQNWHSSLLHSCPYKSPF